jgi:hypothetical protein
MRIIMILTIMHQAFLLCELAQHLTQSDDLDNDIDDIIQVPPPFPA